MLSNCGAGEDSWESLGQQGAQTWQSYRKSALNIHWNNWRRSSNTLATWHEEPTHWKKSWCWERLRAGGEGSNRGWDGWMESLINEHESEHTLGDREGQGSLVCCGPWVTNSLKQVSDWTTTSIPGPYSQTIGPGSASQHFSTNPMIWLHSPVSRQQLLSLLNSDFTHYWASTSLGFPRVLQQAAPWLSPTNQQHLHKAVHGDQLGYGPVQLTRPLT